MKGKFALVLALPFLFARVPPAAAQTTSASFFYSFPDRGGTVIQTTGGGGPVAVGYARVAPGGGTTSPAGLAIFGFRANGLLVSESAVPAMQPVLSGRTYAEINGPLNTGVAFANPNSISTTISFYFTDQSGNSTGLNTIQLDPGAQIAKFLNEQPFNAPRGFTGTFTFASTAAVGVIALRGLTNERGEFLIATQTVAPVLTTSTAAVVMAQFVDGGGWTTQVLLVNTTDTSITGTVQFFDEGSATAAAVPLNITVNGRAGTSFNYSLPARASTKLQTSGTGTTSQTGSVQVTPTGGSNAPSAYAVFSLVRTGVTVSQASVAAQALSTAFRLYVESIGTVGSIGSINTGIAVTNPSAAPTTVNFELIRLDGTSTGLTSSITVPASGHAARFVQELFPQLIPAADPASVAFRGVLRVNALVSPIGVMGLRTRYNDRGDFLTTTTPASNELSTTSFAETIFPHIVDNGGYTTQFILFSGIQNQSALGTLNFFNQSGQAVSLTYK